MSRNTSTSAEGRNLGIKENTENPKTLEITKHLKIFRYLIHSTYACFMSYIRW
jgi:hypothetical protein